MTEPLDILCINCQEMINSERIFSHSFICVFPDLSSSLSPAVSDFSQIQSRIQKLKNSLEDLVFQRLKSESFAFKYLLKKSSSLLLITEISTDSVESTNAITISVKKFAKSMIKPGLIIYSERLRELASEKTQILIESLANSGCSLEIIQLLQKKYSEIIKIKSDASVEGNLTTRANYRELSENLQNIDEIASQISRVMTQRSSTNSLLSPEGDENRESIEEIESMFRIKEEEESVRSTQDLHKYFYSMCLRIKLSYSSRHPSQYIQINQLYKKAIDLQIPMEKWENFIKDEFSRPEKWVDPKHMQTNI